MSDTTFVPGTTIRSTWLNDVNDTVYELPTSNGASLIGFIQAGVGAIQRSVQDELRESFKPTQYGAVGTADDTAVIQEAIDALPAGATLNGLGKTYVVTSLNLKSNMGFENFYLTTKASAVDGVSPITIDGRVSQKTNISIRRVYVDGNRANQTLIIGATGEDGARHGFRIIGDVSNLLIEDFSANNCGTDGVEIFSAIAHATDADFAFSNITLRNFTCNGNRRHGLSFDSIEGVTIENYTINGNGLDLNGTDIATHGNRGARVGNTLANPCYGSGIDFEGYGIGSCIRKLRIRNGVSLGNARSAFVFYDTASQIGAGFAVRGDISIANSTLDYGIDPSSDGKAISFSCDIGNVNLGVLYRGVDIVACTLSGGISARTVDRLTISGGEIKENLTAYPLVLDHSTNTRMGAALTGTGKTVYQDTALSTFSVNAASPTFPSPPVFAYSSGAGIAANLTNVAYTEIENRGNGTYTFLVTADWTPNANGISVFSLTPAAGCTINAPALADVTNNNTGDPILANHNPISGQMRFIGAGLGIPHKLQLLAAVNT